MDMNASRGRIAATLATLALAPVHAADMAGLERLRNDVAALAEPHLVRDADVRVKVAQSVFTKGTSIVGGARTFEFQGTGKTGHVWSQGGGVLGCGGFAEINDGGKAFRFAVTMHSLAATWQPDGRLATRVDLGFNASGNVKGHAHGAAGMCEGPSLTYPLGRWSCDCPIGGGVGSNAGFSGQERRTFDGYMAFAAHPNGDLEYGLFLTAPREIPVTVSVGLQHIGNVGIPISIGVPTGQLATGKWNGLIQTRGKARIGDKERDYHLALKDLKVSPDASGLDLRAKVDFNLQGPTQVGQNSGR